jgi:hypothetical protein
LSSELAMTAQRFRIYNIDRSGVIDAPLDFTFDNAIEAFDYANRQRTKFGVELWRGAELIARLKARPYPVGF